MSIIEHAENYLGSIKRGWGDAKSEENLQVAVFENTPFHDVSTFLSLGMSKKELVLTSGKKVRQELVFTVQSITISGMIVSFLMSLCMAILERRTAVLRGELIPLSRDLSERIGFEAIYCTIPAYFNENFCSYEETTPSTVIVWVVPVYESEAKYIKENGWESFEDLLEELDPDLCSLRREAVV